MVEHRDSDGIKLISEFLFILKPDDLVHLEAAHDGVTGAETGYAAAVDSRIEKPVLTEHIERTVRHGRAGQTYAAPGDGRQASHEFRA